MTLSFTDAFRAFGATLVNAQWAYSSIAKDGSLVISCWSHKLKLVKENVVGKITSFDNDNFVIEFRQR
jgi:hypothetical protein